MDQKTVLALSLCFLIFIFWQKTYLEPRMPTNPPVGQQEVKKEAPQVYKETPTAALSKPMEQTKPNETKSMESFSGTVSVNDKNLLFSNWSLKNYKKDKSDAAQPIDFSVLSNDPAQGEMAFDLPEYAYLENIQGSLSQSAGGLLWTYEDGNLRITKEIKAVKNEESGVQINLKAEFKAKVPKYAFLSLVSRAPDNDAEAEDRQLLYWSNKEITRILTKDEVKLQESLTPAKWIALSSRYFLLALLPAEEIKALVQPLDGGKKRISLVYPVQGNSFSTSLRAYFGPKQIQLLRTMDPTLDHTVDLGWFTFFAYPLLRVMQWLYKIFQNYGLSIIFLTLLVNILTYPLNLKSMKSMREMAKIQPQIQKLKEKFGDDKEGLNREMLSLMKTHGYNPMAGCLPILVQLPVFIALYRVLYSSIELYQAPFAFWIQDLSAKDPYYVTPVILTLVMFINQKLTPNTTMDPTQAKMMQFMPIIFGVFMLPLPAGLTIYMLVNSLAGILRQLMINKKLGISHAVQGAKA